MKLSEAFEAAAEKGRRALIAYLMGGDPAPSRFIDYAVSVAEQSDILEVGIPFSDPIADGKVIQEASVRALSAGMGVGAVLEACGVLSDRLPVVLMCYYNTVHRAGEEEFISRACASGVSGIIVPDLPLEEGRSFRNRCRKAGLDAILLAAPSTPAGRDAAIAHATRGFLYLVSRYGVTGERASLSEQALPLIRKYREICTFPVAIGFGISTPQQVREVAAAGADGIVVGSAIVSRIGQGSPPSEVGSFVGTLRAATFHG